MNQIEWSDKFATGIKVIDAQHMRILNYINELNDVQQSHDQNALREIILNLIDYTLSHFAFEEALMEESGFGAATEHVHSHNAFRTRIENFSQRYEQGEDISHELLGILNTWLINHIAEDDSSYVPFVKTNMPEINTRQKKGWISINLKKFFGH